MHKKEMKVKPVHPVSGKQKAKDAQKSMEVRFMHSVIDSTVLQKIQNIQNSILYRIQELK